MILLAASLLIFEFLGVYLSILSKGFLALLKYYLTFDLIRIHVQIKVAFLFFLIHSRQRKVSLLYTMNLLIVLDSLMAMLAITIFIANAHWPIHLKD